MDRPPSPHASCWRLDALLRDGNPVARAALASERLLNVAGGLPPGSRMTLVLAGDGAGRVSVSLHTIGATDEMAGLIGWMSEGVGLWELCPNGAGEHLGDPDDLGPIAEVLPAVRAPLPPAALQLSDPLGEPEAAVTPDLWPVPFLDDGMAIIQALASTRAAQVRVHLAPASPVERQIVAGLTRRSVQSRDPIRYSQYMGTPVQVRCFVAQSGTHLSPRLRAAMGRLGVGLHLADLDWSDPQTRAAWQGDPFTLSGAVQPFGVAQCLVRLPACGDAAIRCGIPTRQAETPAVPLTSATETPVRGLRLGTAVTEDGSSRAVRVGIDDLLLHTQILGAPGTGKSTLLAALVSEAAAAGIGVSVLESHGPLVERIVRELPESAVDRAILVRSGDVANPVPLNVLGNADSELIIEVMLQVLRELFDPMNQGGIVGPRFERAFSLALRALTVLFGRRATMSALPHVLVTPRQVGELAQVVRQADPDAAAGLQAEFANLRDQDFAELVAWINSKMQRLISTSELRAIMSTGQDAVDVTRVIDDAQVLLVDLAAPSIGPLGAQLLGEMWLAKHWAALAQRKDRSRPHLLIVDEAHLFASGLLPRLISEARKFGVGVVLAHQNLEQLTTHLRDAALASTANVISFRSGPREAISALSRLGTWAGGSLTRLPRFQAAATLSQGTTQTDAFTLNVDHNTRSERDAAPPDRLARVLAATHRRFVDPYRGTPIIDAAAVSAAVRIRREETRPTRHPAPVRPAPPPPGAPPPAPSASTAESGGSSFLDEWLAQKRQAHAQTGGAGDAAAEPMPEQASAGVTPPGATPQGDG